MSALAKIRFLQVTPRKATVVANAIRGKKVQEALDFLLFTKRYVARDFRKLIQSALANAEQKGGMDPDNLYIKVVTVDRGPIHKRWSARARGSASRIEKRTSHITLVLDEK